MSRRVVIWLGFVGCVLAPAMACGQVAHEAPSEQLRSGVANAPAGDLPDIKKATDAIVESTNSFRKDEKRAPVQINAKLLETARYFANFMAKTGKYGHTADDQSPADRAKKHGYDYCLVLENIAYQYRSDGFSTNELSSGFFEGWKHSPGHRKNMLDPDVTETAVAIARSEETGYYYAVQMFGRPHSLAIEFSITNETPVELKYQIGEEKFSLPPRFIRTHQRCRPETVSLAFPDDDAPASAKTLKPNNGDQFVISKQTDGYRVRRK